METNPSPPAESGTPRTRWSRIGIDRTREVCRVSRWMVVRNEQGIGAPSDRSLEDFARMDGNAVEGSAQNLKRRSAERGACGVDRQHQKDFLFRPGLQGGAKQGRCRRRGLDATGSWASRACLVSAPDEFEGGGEFQHLDFAKPPDFPPRMRGVVVADARIERPPVAPNELSDGMEGIEKPPRQFAYVAPRRARLEQYREQRLRLERSGVDRRAQLFAGLQRIVKEGERGRLSHAADSSTEQTPSYFAKSPRRASATVSIFSA